MSTSPLQSAAEKLGCMGSKREGVTPAPGARSGAGDAVTGSPACLSLETNDAFTKDAARYRFIRDPENAKGKSDGDRICEMWRVILAFESTPEQMDAAIDAARSAEETSTAPTPEHAKTGTCVTIVCDGCRAQADLPRVGREGEFMSLQPAKGWQLYPRRLCPKCLSENGSA